MLISDKDVIDNLNSESTKKPLSARCGNVLMKAIRKMKSFRVGSGLKKKEDTISVNSDSTIQINSDGSIGTAVRGVYAETLAQTIRLAFDQWNRNGKVPVPIRTHISKLGGSGDKPSSWFECLFYFQNEPGNGTYPHIGTFIAWDDVSIFIGILNQPTTSQNYDHFSLVWSKMAKNEQISAIKNPNGDILSSVNGASTNDPSCPVSGALDTSDFYDTVQNSKSFFGSINENNTWYNALSVRHRNGNSDGKQFGMVLYSDLTKDSNLTYRQHINGSWKDKRIILDSLNYGGLTATKAQLNDSLRTMQGSTGNRSIGAGSSWNQTVTFAIPSGWKYVGCLGTWTGGAILINYAIDTIGMGTTGNVGLQLWSINHTNTTQTYSMNAKILIQRIF